MCVKELWKLKFYKHYDLSKANHTYQMRALNVLNHHLPKCISCTWFCEVFTGVKGVGEIRFCGQINLRNNGMTKSNEVSLPRRALL